MSEREHLIRNKSKQEKFVEVDADTLDNIVFSNEGICKHEEVNWIKIDVEGAELEVLKGAHNILSKSKDIALLIEIHNLSEGNNLYDDIMNLLKSYNFKQEFEKTYSTGEKMLFYVNNKNKFVNKIIVEFYKKKGKNKDEV